MKIMANKQIQSLQQTIDEQFIEWRRTITKEIPKRVGLTFYTNKKGENETTR
jgi:hypothetical protein